MKFEVIKVTPFPPMPYGKRPIPMLMLHIANCGRNCGMRRGRPVPCALPIISEDPAGEAREFAHPGSKLIKFAPLIGSRRWPSAKFKLAKQKIYMLRSPPPPVVDAQIHCKGAQKTAPGVPQGRLVMNESKNIWSSIKRTWSSSPNLTTVAKGNCLGDVAPQPSTTCESNWSGGEGETKAATFTSIAQDVKGESRKGAEDPQVLALSSIRLASSSLGYDASDESPTSDESSEDGECVYVRSTGGLLGLALRNMPELTSMSTLASGIEDLLTPPESPGRYEMDITNYHKSLVDDMRSRFLRRSESN